MFEIKQFGFEQIASNNIQQVYENKAGLKQKSYQNLKQQISYI